MRKEKNEHMFLFGRPTQVRLCDCPGCGQKGDYKAPKSRQELTEYYWFCLDHVRAYNASWDYFGGLTPEEIETRIREATVWERPTWPMGEAAKRREGLGFVFGMADTSGTENTQQSEHPLAPGERAALDVLDLDAAVDLQTLKARYRQLVKQYHPDLNRDDAAAEEKFKTINQAFSFLRKLYGEDPEEVL